MYKKTKHIHFVGVGGIGMSGIAEIVKLQGYTVSGCDASAQNSKIIEHLQSLGCTIYEGHAASHVDQADVLVYSSAVNKESAEIEASLKKGIPVIPRGLMLAELMRSKYSVAISGAHGKTTTTSMVSHILIETGIDPTVVVGGILKNLSSNIKLGRGNWLIAESDESDRSFLYLNPCIAIVTNIDAEHLDTYKDLDDIKQTFKNFLSRLPFYGKAIVCLDDHNVQSILPLPHVATLKYGLLSNADIVGKIISLGRTETIFEVYDASGIFLPKNSLFGTISLKVPGQHNVLNALAAITLSLELEIPFPQIKHALESFKGVERRFEFKGTACGAEIFDDYGHHPAEIKATLLVAKNRARNKLHVAFQPHRFTRTQKLWQEFIDTLAYFPMETLYVADIYPASEQPIEGISSKNLVAAIKEKNPSLNVIYAPDFDTILQHATHNLVQDDLLLTIGAGKINKVGEELIKNQKDVSCS